MEYCTISYPRHDKIFLTHRDAEYFKIPIKQFLEWGCIPGYYITQLKKIWNRMKERCYKTTHNRYKSYGARGIQVCQYWMDFHNFFNWAISNGYEIDKTIDRIHNDLNYCPNNCRWVSWKDNQRYKGKISRPEIGY